MNDTVKIRVDVPLDLHKGCTLLGIGKPLDQANTIGQRVYQAAGEAFDVLYTTYGATVDAERAAHKEPVPGHQRRHLMRGGRPVVTTGHENDIAAASHDAVERANLAIDRRVKEIEGYANALATRVAEALDHPERKTPLGMAQAAEVRAHAKSLKTPKARREFIDNAVAQGDRPTLAAVLNAPPFLSGLDAETHRLVREQAARKFAPVDFSQLQATNTVMERLRAGVGTLARRREQLAAAARAVALDPDEAIDALRRREPAEEIKATLKRAKRGVRS